MTSMSFMEFVNNILCPSHHLPSNFPPSISLRTAIQWLHQLGFKPITSQNGDIIIYMDMKGKMCPIDNYLYSLNTQQLTHHSQPPINKKQTSGSPETSNTPRASASAAP